MLINQQQQPFEILQEYVQVFSDLLLKLSRLQPHQPKDIAHIKHFIQNLHNQKSQHYVLGKSSTYVQNTFTLAQKKDAELRTIKGLHNHNSCHEINNIYPKHNDKPINVGHCYTCKCLHLLKIVTCQHVVDVN